MHKIGKLKLWLRSQAGGDVNHHFPDAKEWVLSQSKVDFEKTVKQIIKTANPSLMYQFQKAFGELDNMRKAFIKACSAKNDSHLLYCFEQHFGNRDDISHAKAKFQITTNCKVTIPKSITVDTPFGTKQRNSGWVLKIDKGAAVVQIAGKEYNYHLNELKLMYAVN